MFSLADEDLRKGLPMDGIEGFDGFCMCICKFHFPNICELGTFLVFGAVAAFAFFAVPFHLLSRF